jgi:hypothetical protein
MLDQNDEDTQNFTIRVQAALTNMRKILRILLSVCRQPWLVELIQ